MLKSPLDKGAFWEQNVKAPFRQGGLNLFHKLVDGLAQVVDGVFITGGYRVHHTVVDMVFQNHFARIVQGRTDRRQLDQNFRTVIALFHHPLDLFQVADGPGKAVDDRFLIFVDMAVGMGKTVGVHIGMVVDLFLHCSAFFLCFPYHTLFWRKLQPPKGVVFGTRFL